MTYCYLWLLCIWQIPQSGFKISVFSICSSGHSVNAPCRGRIVKYGRAPKTVYVCDTANVAYSLMSNGWKHLHYPSSDKFRSISFFPLLLLKYSVNFFRVVRFTRMATNVCVRTLLLSSLCRSRHTARSFVVPQRMAVEVSLTSAGVRVPQVGPIPTNPIRQTTTSQNFRRSRIRRMCRWGSVASTTAHTRIEIFTQAVSSGNTATSAASSPLASTFDPSANSSSSSDMVHATQFRHRRSP